MKFTAYLKVIGQLHPLDKITIITNGCVIGSGVVSAIDDAMRQALGWAAETDWPDGDYPAAVWVEDATGNVVAQDVEIQDGKMSI